MVAFSPKMSLFIAGSNTYSPGETVNPLVILNTGGIIAAVVGLLFGVVGAIICIKMVASSNTPRDKRPWWGGGIVVGALMVMLAILTLAGVI
jgi:hypothetical protein